MNRYEAKALQNYENVKTLLIDVEETEFEILKLLQELAEKHPQVDFMTMNYEYIDTPKGIRKPTSFTLGFEVI